MWGLEGCRTGGILWGSFGFLLSPQITETSNWKAQNAQHKLKAMISSWGEITFVGRGIWDWTWGNPVGQFRFFQRGSALKYVTMLISMQMRLAFASPPSHEYKCTWSSLVLNSSTQAHAVTLARFSFRVPSIRKQQESWVFFIGGVVWVVPPGPMSYHKDLGALVGCAGDFFLFCAFEGPWGLWGCRGLWEPLGALRAWGAL